MLENAQINELIKRWQDNRDQAAMTELYNGLFVYRQHLLTRGWCNGVGLDAEALLDDAFLKAINGFDPTKSTFVKRFGHIFRQLVVGYNRDNWYANTITPIEPQDDQYINYKQEYIISDIDRSILEEAIDKLENGREIEILRMLLAGDTFIDIKTKFGYSKSTTNYFIKRAQNSLREVYS